MTEEQYRKAMIIHDEIDQLQNLLGDDFRHITTVTTYNRNDVEEKYYTREFRVSDDLSKEITEVIVDRLNRLQIEMENL